MISKFLSPVITLVCLATVTGCVSGQSSPPQPAQPPAKVKQKVNNFQQKAFDREKIDPTKMPETQNK